MNAPLFVTAVSSSSSGGTMTLTLPASLKPDHLVLVLAQVNVTTAPLSEPTGLKLMDASPASGATHGSQVSKLYRGIAADLPSTLTVSAGSAVKVGLLLVAYASAVFVSHTMVGETVSRTSHPNAVVDVSTVPARVVSLIGVKASSLTNTFSAPGGMTPRRSQLEGGGGGILLAAADIDVATAGSYGAGDWAVSAASAAATAFSVVLAPAAPTLRLGEGGWEPEPSPSSGFDLLELAETGWT